MKNQIPFSEQDQADQPPASTLCWWRTAAESGRHKVGEEFSDLSGLTPRLKVIRELERLALVAPEGLDDLRHKLLTYRSGDFWLPTGGIKKEEMEIPPLITVLVVGLSGGGKSSLVNLMYSVLGRSGLIPFAQTSSESSNYTTMYMEEHNVLRSMRNGFCMYDTRGFDCYEMSEGLEEVKAWVADGVRHYQLCSRPGDKEPCGGVALSMGSQLSSSRFAKRQVNCVMVVADLAEINKGFKDGDLKSIEATRELFQCPSIRKSNENPILILTHGDMLSCEERINARLKMCEYLGISETTGAYDIACMTEQGILPEESDPVTAFALTEAIYRALLQSDRTHLPKRKLKDWVLPFLSWIMCSIAAFFAMLALFFSKLGCNKKKL
ncbi:uncharacterized protein LOC130763877 [Actinidia eriantha]|uniref:uncharacterized protein LOC130763877 n=1 Tax=Actinidia eriantha TaxID=165200 RepID=UPI002589FFE9|nr:uncharacterized protein LOC130763877 [Actinidia eriantha]